jgi:hypothetical protein
MNIWTPTGKKLESFPQWVGRLLEENKKLLKKLKEYEDRERAKSGDGAGQKASGEDEKGRSHSSKQLDKGK